MVRIHGKSSRLFLPASADVFISCESLERLESLGKVIGHPEGLQVRFQVVVGLVVTLFYSGVFARAVHPFHLPIRPGMVGFGQPMVDAMLLTDAIKNMLKGVYIALTVAELDAVISQHRMDLIGHNGN
jgi:hypothetical protein